LSDDSGKEGEMSLIQVSRFLYDLGTDPKLREEFHAEPEKSLERYALTDGEKRAVANVAVGELYRMGVHPLLLMQAAVVFRMPLPEFLERMSRPGEASLP
jgi:hypothetical protein